MRQPRGQSRPCDMSTIMMASSNCDTSLGEGFKWLWHETVWGLQVIVTRDCVMVQVIVARDCVRASSDCDTSTIMMASSDCDTRLCEGFKWLLHETVWGLQVIVTLDCVRALSYCDTRRLCDGFKLLWHQTVLRIQVIVTRDCVKASSDCDKRLCEEIKWLWQ